MTKEASQNNSLKSHAIGMIIVSVVQYILGMVTSFFVTFPESSDPEKLWSFSTHQVLIILHIIVGFLLLLGTIVLLIRSLKQKSRPWLISSSIALIAVLGSIITGSLFISSQSDVYSLIMSIGLITALLAYFWGLYTTK